ncbi:MAG: MFS transporter [Candidatus Aureabacteria bacterium]|nr:MFS transporter [Candidatus Auribacterota bacterium]
MLANQLFAAALGVFMVVLVVGLGMDPVLAGILGAAPRIFDAITDPIMGYISDHTNSRWGRRRPYIFIGAIITGLSFIFMWQIHAEDSETYNFVYFLLWSLVFYFGYTIFATPYIALGYEMSDDFNERTRLMGAAQLIGQFAWVLAPWSWVIIYNPKLFDSAPEGARYLSIWVGLGCMLIGLIPALICKQKVIPKEEQKSINFQDLMGELKKFGNGIWITFKCKPFLKLCAVTFLIFNGFQTIAGFAWYIIVFYLFKGSMGAAGTWPAWFGTISALCTIFLVIPVVTSISEKIGKRGAFIVSTSISIVGYILKWWCFDPTNPYLMFLPLPFLAFGIGGLFTLMMSMTADVCDLDELNNGERREGVFGAVYWWMVKLGQAVAIFFSGLVLKGVGFKQGQAEQLTSTLTGLRIADIVIPVIGALIAIAVIWSYNLTGKRANEIRDELEKRRGKSQLA